MRVLEMSTNDAWVRDTGPTFVVDDAGELRGVSWRFNAWGGLARRAVLPVGPRRPGRAEGRRPRAVHRYLPDLVLEGGSIDVDGQGTVLTTEECLLNPNRNPDLTREQIEERLRENLASRRGASGCRAGCTSTRPTGTSTTSRASPPPGS